MEQVNATVSRYGNKVKHMTEESNFHVLYREQNVLICVFSFLAKSDTLAAGLLYMNRERMPKFLRLNILTTASQPWKAYEAQQKIKNDTKQQSIKEYGTDKAMRSRHWNSTFN